MSLRIALNTGKSQVRQLSRLVGTEKSGVSSFWRLAAAGAAAGSLALWYSLERTVKASDLELHAYKNPWAHNGYASSVDYNGVRRGWQVYKQVCAACHSLEHVQYISFVDVFMTLDEAKAEAAEQLYLDGPGDDGKMYERPGKVTDFVKSPYKNDVEAKLANNGAAPPDMSLISQARMEKGKEDYIFALLTGYEDPPGGVELGEGQAYNPYFTGGVISMAQQLFDEGTVYDDGTPATMSQQAKDVSTFLHWVAETKEDEWKVFRMKLLFTLPFFCLGLFYIKKLNWTVLKSQKTYWQRMPFRGYVPTLLQGARRSPHELNNTPKVP